MITRAGGTLDIASWDEQPYAEIDGHRRLTTTSVTQKLRGDIEGEGSATWLSVHLADGTAEYAGFQRMMGRVGDAAGSIVLRMSGGYDGSVARSEWVVAEGAGTGALEGLSGSGVSEATSDGTPTYSLEYDLG